MRQQLYVAKWFGWTLAEVRSLTRSEWTACIEFIEDDGDMDAEFVN